MSKKTIILATASLIAIAAGTTGTAQAGSALLYPYIMNTDTAFTFLTLIQNPLPDGGNPGQSIPTDTHFDISYITKFVDAPSDTPCHALQTRGSFHAAGGLMQWEAAGRYDLPEEFGDQAYVERTLADVGNYRMGYAIVRYDTPMEWEQLHGEALVIDTATGMIYAYTANRIPMSNGDFAMDGGTEFLTSWLPQELAGTQWFVLPVDYVDAMFSGNQSTDVYISTHDRQRGAYGRGGTYHAAQFQTKPVSACGHIFSLETLSGSYNAQIRDGGWFTLKTTTPSLIWKIQQSAEMGFPVTAINSVPPSAENLQSSHSRYFVKNRLFCLRFPASATETH